MEKLMIEDRRVRKTKRVLRKGLAELMLEKELRNITVRELTDKVDIHRATFYVHYKDIYDLYTQMEDAVINEMYDIISETERMQPNDYFTILINYIVENKHICRVLFGSKEQNNFLDHLMSLLKKTSLDNWFTLHKIPNGNEDLEYYVQYHLMGCLSIISKWTESNFKFPEDRVVKILADLDVNFDGFIKNNFMP